MNISEDDLAILNAAAPFIDAKLFNASDLVQIYNREMERGDDVELGLEKVSAHWSWDSVRLYMLPHRPKSVSV